MRRSLWDDFLVGGERWKECVGEIVHAVTRGNFVLDGEPQVHIYQLAEGLDLPGRAHIVGIANGMTACIFPWSASGPAVPARDPFDEREVPFDFRADTINFVELVLAIVIPLDEMLARLIVGLLIVAIPSLLNRNNGLHPGLPKRVHNVLGEVGLVSQNIPEVEFPLDAPNQR